MKKTTKQLLFERMYIIGGMPINEDEFKFDSQVDDYAADPEHIDIARRTSRTQRFDPEKTQGRGFSEAIVPNYAINNLASKGDKILDFGAGKHPYYVQKFRSEGYNIDGWDLPPSVQFWKENYDEDFVGQIETPIYDIVYASNVLNVASNEEFLERMTIEKIFNSLKSGGKFVGNYPKSPRKNPTMTEGDLYNMLNNWFEDVQFNKKTGIYTARK